MMKMPRGIACCCVSLFLILTSVSAVHQRLNSINDLKKVNFGQFVPKHSLLLLHWFANTVDIDNNDVVQLTFDPDHGDYGAHHYGNFEGLLDQAHGYRYYTIGNLNEDTSVQLPSYVLNPPRIVVEHLGRNRDRIIVGVGGRGGSRRIDRVYITQHYETFENRGTQYDPAHTYQITTNLLREIREFSVGENAQTLWHLRNRFGSSADDFQITVLWGHLACLGLFLFIVTQEKYSLHQNNNRPGQSNRSGRNSLPGHDNRAGIYNNRQGNSNRLENNNRQGNNNRLENNNRQGNTNRQGNNNNRQGNNDRLENYDGLEFINIPENTSSPCRRIAWAVCISVCVILTAVTIFLVIFFAKKKG